MPIVIRNQPNAFIGAAAAFATGRAEAKKEKDQLEAERKAELAAKVGDRLYDTIGTILDQKFEASEAQKDRVARGERVGAGIEARQSAADLRFKRKSEGEAEKAIFERIDDILDRRRKALAERKKGVKSAALQRNFTEDFSPDQKTQIKQLQAASDKLLAEYGTPGATLDGPQTLTAMRQIDAALAAIHPQLIPKTPAEIEAGKIPTAEQLAKNMVFRDGNWYQVDIRDGHAKLVPVDEPRKEILELIPTAYESLQATEIDGMPFDDMDPIEKNAAAIALANVWWQGMLKIAKQGGSAGQGAGGDGGGVQPPVIPPGFQGGPAGPPQAEPLPFVKGKGFKKENLKVGTRYWTTKDGQEIIGVWTGEVLDPNIERGMRSAEKFIRNSLKAPK